MSCSRIVPSRGIMTIFISVFLINMACDIVWLQKLNKYEVNLSASMWIPSLTMYKTGRHGWILGQRDDAQTRKILNNLIVAFGLTDRKSKIHFWWTSINFLFKNKVNNTDPRCISVLQQLCLKYFISPLATSKFVLQLGNSLSSDRGVIWRTARNILRHRTFSFSELMSGPI